MPNETFADMARMRMSESVVVGEGRGSASGGRGGLSDGGGIMFSTDHAEGIYT